MADAAIVTDIECPCGFVVIIDTPDRQIGISRQIRREWFSHLREQHPDTYAVLSPGFAVELEKRRVIETVRLIQRAEKYNLAEKKGAKGGIN
jgi:hypothetical protein